MAEVAADWATRSGGERGFSMGRFDADYVAGQRCFLAWSGDRLVAFATFHATAEEWVLDLMRSASDMPDGTMHGLITQAIRAAGSEGVARFSLAAMLRKDVPVWDATLARLWRRFGTASFQRELWAADDAALYGRAEPCSADACGGGHHVAHPKSGKFACPNRRKSRPIRYAFAADRVLEI